MKKTEYGKVIELTDAIRCRSGQYYGTYEGFGERVREKLLKPEGEKSERIILSVVPVPWNENKAYEDDLLYAYDLKCGKAAAGMGTDITMAECTVEHKQTGRIVIAYADTLGNGIYELMISEESMLEEVLKSGEVLSTEKILEKAETFYGSFEEARDSGYYEIFRRLMYSLEEMVYGMDVCQKDGFKNVSDHRKN